MSQPFVADVPLGTFPTNYTVQYQVWYSGGKNPNNADIDAWHDPEPRAVIGWSSRRQETEDGKRAAGDDDYLRLQVPYGFTWAARDKVTVPGYGTFRITGAADANAGFHGWTPGLVLEMLKSEG